MRELFRLSLGLGSVLVLAGCECSSDKGPVANNPTMPTAGASGEAAGGEGGAEGQGGRVGGGGSTSEGGQGGVNGGMAGGGGDGGSIEPSCTGFICDAPGETGRALRSAEVGCICETRPGYFVGLEGKTTSPCDADGDGWINDNAQPSLEGDDPVLKANARCDLRMVTSVVLENEAAAEKAIDLDEDLPLYESARNDGSPASMPPAPYGGTALPAVVLSSLTKACVATTQDYNDNGVSDVGEWTGKELGASAKRNDALKKYYSVYLSFSYFLELYDGWFETRNVYRIRERARTDRAGAGVPLEYPNGTDSYWQQCERHRDQDYGPSAQSRAGGDFTDPTTGWSGMTQHSQFKCVSVLSEAGYGTAFNATVNPEIVFKHSGTTGVARRRPGAGTFNGCPDVRVADGVEVFDWTANDCHFTESSRASGIDALNPKQPKFSCTPIALANLQPSVRLVAVGYTNAACPPRSDQVTARPSDYRRGCINVCAEHGVISCPNYDPSAAPDSGRYTCDDDGSSRFGVLQCGCGRSYGGPNCEIGCPGDEALTSDDFSIETRSGYWMCGRVVASTGLLSGGSYSLQGYVPIAPTDGTVLESPDGKIKLQSR